MTWAPTETQRSIYELLKNDATLQTLLGGDGTDLGCKIYDHVPDNKTYPYVKMEIKPMDNRANHEWDGVEINYALHVWNQKINQGDLKVQQIQERIDVLLNRNDTICIDGWNVVAHLRSTVNILDEPDGRTKHGIQTYKLFLGEA